MTGTAATVLTEGLIASRGAVARNLAALSLRVDPEKKDEPATLPPLAARRTHGLSDAWAHARSVDAAARATYAAALADRASLSAVLAQIEKDLGKSDEIVAGLRRRVFERLRASSRHAHEARDRGQEFASRAGSASSGPDTPCGTKAQALTNACRRLTTYLRKVDSQISAVDSAPETDPADLLAMVERLTTSLTAVSDGAWNLARTAISSAPQDLRDSAHPYAARIDSDCHDALSDWAAAEAANETLGAARTALRVDGVPGEKRSPGKKPSPGRDPSPDADILVAAILSASRKACAAAQAAVNRGDAAAAWAEADSADRERSDAVERADELKALLTPVQERAEKLRTMVSRPMVAKSVATAQSHIDRLLARADLDADVRRRMLIDRAALVEAGKALPWAAPTAPTGVNPPPPVVHPPTTREMVPPELRKPATWLIVRSDPELAYSLACYLTRWRGVAFDDALVTGLFDIVLAVDAYCRFIPQDPELVSAPDGAGFAELRTRASAEWQQREAARKPASTPAAEPADDDD